MQGSEKVTPFKHALTGFGCSAAAIVSMYPLDTIARQFHVTSRTNATTRSLVSGMIRKGPFSFYKGVIAAAWTQPIYWAANLPVYDALKRAALSHGYGDSFRVNMCAGWFAGATATIITNPLWVVRYRLQTEILRNRHGGYVSVVRRLWLENGYRAFLRGTNITLVKNIQMAFLLPMFDRWTKEAKESKNIWGTLSNAIGIGPTVAVAAVTAKIVSSTAVYPLDVIRTNVRYEEGKRIRYSDVTRELIGRKGGVLNLFRGIGWYWASSAGMFAVMMTLKHYIN